MTDIPEILSEITTAFQNEENLNYHPFWENDYKKELQSIFSSLTQSQHFPQHLERAAKLCALCGLYEPAEQLLEEATRKFSTQNRFPYFLSLVQFKNNKIDKALESLHVALKRTHIAESMINHIFGNLDVEKNGAYSFYLIISTFNRFSIDLLPNDFNGILLPYPVQDQADNILYGYGLIFNNICNSLAWERNGPMQRLFEKEFQINGDSYWYHLNAGKLSWILEDREKADYHFQKTKDISIQQDVPSLHFDCGIYTWLSEKEMQSFLDNSDDLPDPFRLGSWNWSYADLKDGNPELSIILGCESNYFRFFPKLLLSLLRAHQANQYKTKTVLSLALDNPLPAQIRFLKQIAAHIHDHIPNFYLTYGYGLCRYRDGAYFASIRYLFAPELMEHYPVKTLIIDIDAIFPLNFYSRFTNLMQNYDFGLRLFAFDENGKQKWGEPWCLGAGVLYLGNREISTKIVNFLKIYLCHAYQPKNPTNWCIDQCALVQAFAKYIRPQWANLKIKPMDEGEPFLILSQHIGGKDELYQQNGIINIDNFMNHLNLSK